MKCGQPLLASQRPEDDLYYGLSSLFKSKSSLQQISSTHLDEALEQRGLSRYADVVRGSREVSVTYEITYQAYR